jgi:hypothetical protein
MIAMCAERLDPFINLAVVLVLQPDFMGTRSTFPMAAASALLMAAAPRRPSEDVFGIGRLRPHQIPEQAAQLGHGGRQQVQPQSEIDLGFLS